MFRPRPILQDMPRLVKENIVQHMDFLSRFSLRRCSKNFQDMVDKFPIVLKTMQISKQADTVSLRVTFDEVSLALDFQSDPIGYQVLLQGRNIRTIKGDNYLNGAMICLTSLIKHPGTVVKKLTITREGSQNQLETLLSSLKSALSSSNLKIPVEKLNWFMHTDQEDVFSLLTCINLKTIQDIGVLPKNSLSLNVLKWVIAVGMSKTKGSADFYMNISDIEQNALKHCKQFPDIQQRIPGVIQMKRIVVAGSSDYLKLTIHKKYVSAVKITSS